MSVPLWRALAALVASAALAGCVNVSQFYALEREVQELKRQVRGGGGPGLAPEASDTRIAELGSDVESLREQVAELRGQIEELRHDLEQVRQKGAAAAPPRAEAGEPPPPPPVAGEPPPTGGQLASGEVQLYEEAFRLYRAGDHAGAIDRFQAFLHSHPSSEYADNALFWMGECYFRLGDYEQAVLKFEDVTRMFPDGNKVADALYRQGIALREIGKKSKSGQERGDYDAAARQIFERLVSEHPESERVPEARRQLEELR